MEVREDPENENLALLASTETTINRDWQSHGKNTRKLENEMPIAFVDRQLLIDIGR